VAWREGTMPGALTHLSLRYENFIQTFFRILIIKTLSTLRF